MNIIPKVLRKSDLPQDDINEQLAKELEEMISLESKSDEYSGDAFRAPPPPKPQMKPILSLQQNIESMINYKERYEREKADTDEKIKQLQSLSFEQGAVIAGVTAAIAEMESHIPQVPLNKKLEQKIKRSADELRAEANHESSKQETTT